MMNIGQKGRIWGMIREIPEGTWANTHISGVSEPFQGPKQPSKNQKHKEPDFPEFFPGVDPEAGSCRKI
jgi:hypothetical protein